MRYWPKSTYPPVTYCDNPDREQYVYVMTCAHFVKIGIAANLEERRSSVDTHNPFETVVAMYRRVPYAVARWVERNIHAELSAFSHRGEWFKCDLETARIVVHRWCRCGIKNHGSWQRIATGVGRIPGSVQLVDPETSRKPGLSA